jgi:hypothetical protein
MVVHGCTRRRKEKGGKGERLVQVYLLIAEEEEEPLGR